MLRVGYTVFLWLLLPFIAARLWMRGRLEPGYRQRLGERLGRFSVPVGSPLIWVHAVSVGEVRASVPLIEKLRVRYPQHQLLVTCMTAAGSKAIEQSFGSTVHSAFLPYDYPFAVRRFLDHHRPSAGLLMETEIWPNLLAECSARSLPVALANARMSDKSSRGYRRLSRLTRPAFESLRIVCAQTEADADRIAALGAHRVTVTGNLKFDVQPDPRLLAS